MVEIRKQDLSDLLTVRQGPVMKIGWAVHTPCICRDRYAEVRPPSSLFLEMSTPSDYLPDDFGVLYLPVQDLCFSLNEEHERTCRATKGKIYVVCKLIFPLYNNNKPNTGSFMGVGNLLGTSWYWWRRSLEEVFCSYCVIKSVYCCQKGRVLSSVLLICIISPMSVAG